MTITAAYWYRNVADQDNEGGLTAGVYATQEALVDAIMLMAFTPEQLADVRNPEHEDYIDPDDDEEWPCEVRNMVEAATKNPGTAYGPGPMGQNGDVEVHVVVMPT